MNAPARLTPAELRSARAPAAEADPFAPRALLALAWREATTILAVAAAVVALAGWWAFTVTPNYEATATVVLDTREAQVVDIESVMSGLSADSSVVNTEVEVLQSRILLDRVVERLDLESDPEFNPLLVEDGPLTRARHWARATLADLLGSPPPAAAEDPAFRRRQTAIDRLLERMVVRNVPLSYVFTIEVTSEGADKSARIANAIADLYILDQLEAKFEATRQATAWLSDRVAELQGELESAEEKVKTWSSQTTLVSEAALEGTNRQLKDLRERRAEQTARAEESRLLGERLAALAATISAGGEAAAPARAEAAALAGDRRIATAAQDLARLPDGRRADALAARFDALLAAAVDRLAAERTRLSAQADGLDASIAELESRIETESEDLVVLRQLQREAEANRLLYEHFLGRMKETSVQQGIQQADSRTLSPAVAPLHAASPRKLLVLGVAAALGAALGLALVVAREAFDDRARAPEDLEEATGLKVMGVIPDAPSRRRGSVLPYLVERPSSQLAEAVRNLRTSVLLSNVDRAPQVIMVTSSVPGEGKTTSTLMLAANSAALGKKVLVIECDLRRRVFGNYFDMPETVGVLSVLSGETAPEEAIRRDERTGLDVLVGQESRANAADVFSSERFGEFLTEMRARYDFVYIDTPPVLAVPDARVIAGRADAVLYAVRWNATRLKMVRAGLALFERFGVRITGLAMTQADPKRIARYGYAGYGYGYGYGASAARKYYTA